MYAIQNKYFYLYSSLVLFSILNIIWLTLDSYQLGYQWECTLNIFGFHIYFGIDGISFFFIYLTGLLIPLCIIFNWNNNIKIEESMFSLISLELLLLLAFSVLDIFISYIIFEVILIPFFIFIGIMGYRRRRIHAAYLFFFYTVLGSFFLLLGLIIMYFNTGTTDIQVLSSIQIPYEYLIWILLFISFAIKIPIFPFHIWLPEAHVEAPTEGSVLLAGILLKLGTYGFLRFMFPLFSNATYYYSPLVCILSSMGILYASLITLRQIDIKRIIAYSSVSHMNMCILGLFSFNSIGFLGSILLMVGHGVVSGGLFFSIGMLYNRYHTKLIQYYSGIVYSMPIYTTFFMLFTLANISLPGTSNFIGELLILISVIISGQSILLIFIILGIFIGTIYSMWLFNKISFGIPYYNFVRYMCDISLRECSILIVILLFILWIGIYPKSFVDVLYYSIIYNYNKILL